MHFALGYDDVCRDAESTGSHWQGPACRYAAAMFAASLIDGFESPSQENRVFVRRAGISSNT